MIPLTLTGDLQQTLLDYLTTTFSLQDAALEQALVEFLTQDEGKGMFQGPFLQLRLPFRKAELTATYKGLLEIRPSFTPYVHQVQSFERLTSKDGHAPQPTIITTGTGSGKTECFLFPILDHCYRHRGESGIKAIILYPMNALATDQAKRLAAIINQDERLQGDIQAGLYVGGQSSTPQKQMSPDGIIDDRATLRQNPPDILLTNYRMLDFLLMRPEDKPLWSGNGPETLRYLVLDELHTYDGAQGSDVASLIRRLRSRLGTPPDTLCPVGTSATVVSPSGDTNSRLCSFAEEIFATSFPEEAIIGEVRVSQAEFLPEGATRDRLPRQIDSLREQTGESLDSYVAGQMRAWFGQVFDPVGLGSALKTHHLLPSLLDAAQDSVLDVDTICRRLARRDPFLAELDPEAQRLVLQSFLAMISHARVRDGRVERPFLTVQAQIWVREMSRLMREVHPQPRFFWRDDVPLHLKPRGLPAYVCRECGHSGWLAIQREGDEALTDDTQQIYRAYFDRSKNVVYVYPQNGDSAGTSEARLLRDTLCPNCLRLGSTEECHICGVETIPVVRHHETTQARSDRAVRDLQRCPVCATDGGLGILGRQAASLLSVAISHLFTSPINSDQKLLAFTDSVQDASHRAAFFGARTYRFGLRTAIQEALPDNGQNATQGTRLSDFTDQMLDHWLARWQEESLENEQSKAGQTLVSAFMPPDLSDMASYRQFLDGPAKPIPDDLRRDMRSRLSWEVTMEYGLNARLGRSLEKVGSSLATLNSQKLQEAMEMLGFILPEEVALLRSVETDAIHHFVVGLLERTRTRGGIYHPLLHRYLRDQGNIHWLFKRQTPLLSPFGTSSRFPRFLNEGSNRDTFDQFISTMTRPTWYVDWAQRTLTNALGVTEINDIYHQVITTLLNTGILLQKTQGRSTSYGIRPEALLITKNTASVRCDTCSQQWTVTPGSVGGWLDQACLNYRCRGHFQPDVDAEVVQNGSYYRALYEGGQVSRIFSYEHTGLLARDVRERVEKGFKEQDRADAPNLLTATPTLEMGIDIGDLSAIVACAVPPTTANYLQRIGRAGRATGNSLVLTLANVRPHDLYFFEQPLEMIAGSIVPPGCYLDAPNMLKRQFLAFCIDTWTLTTAGPSDKLPRNVKEMLAGLSRDGFPIDLLVYIESQKEDLAERFIGMFAAVVSPANQELLRAYALGDELPAIVMQAVAEAEETREQLRRQYRTLRRERDRIEKEPAQYDQPEEQLAELRRDMQIVATTIKELEDKYTLNFFTDAGLLPNYAFPETGVKLRAIITGVEAPDPEKRFLVKEYVRPAPVAIRELAPFNTFYAEGRKVMVDSLNLQGEDTNVETWQFCIRCTTMALVSTSHYSTTCPKCGSDMWHDAGRQHAMVRLREVSARRDAHRSRSGDDGDDRDRETYFSGRYFEVNPEHTLSAHLIPGLPFGIEALDQVTLREINFGLRDTFGTRTQIAGEEQPEIGFQVCPGCGVVLDPRRRDDPESTRHTRSCRYRGAGGEIPWRQLYLYREMQSEALRILLPVSTVLVNEKLTTFQACLHLGLTSMFQGDPDHLQIGSTFEVTPGGEKQRYLMIYDTVPGGTSYLRDLARPENFRNLLAQALAILTSCRCQYDVRKGACYRCLYSYTSQYEKEHISRRLGVELLTEVLEAWPEIEEASTLSGVDMVSRLESELEQKFIDALKEAAQERQQLSWQERLYNGKRAYQLTVAGNKWLVEPQVLLGRADGVSISSKPDFVFWPQGSLSKTAKPVAVFTDGFAYHVQPAESPSRLPDDVRKRRALIESGEFHVWSLTWDDLAEFENEDSFALSLLDPSKLTRLKGLMRQEGAEGLASAIAENGMHQLLRHLEYPQANDWEKLAGLLSVTLMMPPRPMVAVSFMERLAKAMRVQILRPNLTIPDDAPPGTTLYGVVENEELQLLVYGDKEALTNKDWSHLQVLARLNDEQINRQKATFKQTWRQYLLLSNVFQFLSEFEPLTTELLTVTDHSIVAEVEETIPAAAEDELWKEVFDLAPECEALLNELMAAEVEVPVVGYDLADDRGIVFATAELAWPDRMTAVLLPEQEADKALFEQRGWRTFYAESASELLDSLGVQAEAREA